MNEHAATVHNTLNTCLAMPQVMLGARRHAHYLAALHMAPSTPPINEAPSCAAWLQQMLVKANQQAPGSWRLSDVNAELDLCETYPRTLVVPTAATDELLMDAKLFRSLGRIPTVSWLDVRAVRHAVKEVPFIARSSQPLVGIWGQRSASDESLVQMMRAAAASADPEESLVIIDCRDWLSACANASKGVIGRQAGGTEPTAAYGAREIKFMDMQNIHKVQYQLCVPQVWS